LTILHFFICYDWLRFAQKMANSIKLQYQIPEFTGGSKLCRFFENVQQFLSAIRFALKTGAHCASVSFKAQ